MYIACSICQQYKTKQKELQYKCFYLPRQGLVRQQESGLAGTRPLSFCKSPVCWSVWCLAFYFPTLGMAEIFDIALYITAPYCFFQLQKNSEILKNVTICSAEPWKEQTYTDDLTQEHF